MLLPWKPDGLFVAAIEVFQKLYIDQYPFCYKPGFQWKFSKDRNGTNLRVVHPVEMTYKNKYLGHVIQTFPLITTAGAFVTSLLALFFLWKEKQLKGKPLVFDIRFWAFLLVTVTTWLSAGTYYILTYTGVRHVMVTYRQMIDLHVEVHHVYNTTHNIPQRRRNDEIRIKQYRMILTSATLMWSAIIASYFIMPIVVVAVMLFDIDPFSYVVNVGLTQYFSGLNHFLFHSMAGRSRVLYMIQLFSFRYILNLVCLYEIIRLATYFVLLGTYGLQNTFSGLQMGYAVLLKNPTTYYADLIISWYRKCQLIFAVTEPVMRQNALSCLTCLGVMMITLIYVLIKLRHIMNTTMIFGACVVLCCIGFVTKATWEMAADMDNITRNNLKLGQLIGEKLDLEESKRVFVIFKGQRKNRGLYKKIAKSLKPMGMPLGFGNVTFTTANRDTKAKSIQIMADATINILLTF